jgi:hypothetical protein
MLAARRVMWARRINRRAGQIDEGRPAEFLLALAVRKWFASALPDASGGAI